MSIDPRIENFRRDVLRNYMGVLHMTPGQLSEAVGIRPDVIQEFLDGKALTDFEHNKLKPLLEEFCDAEMWDARADHNLSKPTAEIYQEHLGRSDA